MAPTPGPNPNPWPQLRSLTVTPKSRSAGGVLRPDAATDSPPRPERRRSKVGFKLDYM